MILIQKYGVLLTLLSEETLELVRTWRNDPGINQYLLTRDYISADQQQKWFHQLDTSRDQYFVIHLNGQKVGLVYVTKIDHVEKSGHPGIFLNSENHGNPSLAFRAIFALFDYCFDILGLEKLLAEVLKTNDRAIEFNRAFGYELIPGAGTNEYDVYFVTKETCQKSTEPFKKLI